MCCCQAPPANWGCISLCSSGAGHWAVLRCCYPWNSAPLQQTGTESPKTECCRNWADCEIRVSLTLSHHSAQTTSALGQPVLPQLVKQCCGGKTALKGRKMHHFLQVFEFLIKRPVCNFQFPPQLVIFKLFVLVPILLGRGCCGQWQRFPAGCGGGWQQQASRGMAVELFQADAASPSSSCQAV